jgi:hypothetical protein
VNGLGLLRCVTPALYAPCAHAPYGAIRGIARVPTMIVISLSDSGRFARTQ